MMKKIYLLASLMIAGVQFGNAQTIFGNKKIQGNGKVISVQRSVNDYEQIQVYGSLDVDLTLGREGLIEIEAEENLIEYISTDVEGDKLILRTQKGYNIRPSVRKRIKLTVPIEHINEIEILGSGDIECNELLKTNHLKASVDGSGDINLNIAAKSLNVGVYGSGDIELRGKVNDFDATVDGSGDIDAFKLIAQNAYTSVLGSGDIQVYVEQQLNASTTGSGDIRFKGNPVTVEKKSLGSGSITKH